MSEMELENLITCHGRLTTLLKYCLRAERDERAHRSHNRTDHLGHHFTFSRAGQLQLTATNRRKTKEIIGQADYAIWQGDEATTSGLIIAGTEDYRDLDMVKLRCFAYMSRFSEAHNFVNANTLQASHVACASRLRKLCTGSSRMVATFSS